MSRRAAPHAAWMAWLDAARFAAEAQPVIALRVTRRG